MADNTSTLATPQTSVTDKKPDWFVNSLQGFVPPSLNEMHAEGMYANNFSIEDPETYWGKSDIQKSFTDEKGKVRRDLFDQSYKASLSKYKTHRDTELNLVNFISPPNITTERSGINTPTPSIFKATEDPLGRNYQSGYAFSDGFSAQQRSMKESALATGVRQDNGSYVPPKEFSGKAKFAMGDKGGLLLNEEGKPYLVPVKDGEPLHSWDQVYNPLSESLGAYNAEYSWKNVAASIVKNPINFASQSVDDLIEYGRGALNLWGLDTKETDKSLNNIENWAKGVHIPTTENNEGSFYNLENVADLSQQVLYQLGSMAAVGGTIMALTKNPKLASVGSKLFMTALSAGAMQEVARDNGLSKKESAVLLGITSAALYPLMSLSEAAIGKLATKESRAALAETISNATNNGALIREIAKNPTKATLRTVYNNLKEGGKSWAFKTEKSAPLVVGAVSESLEETAEQLVDLSVRGGYNAYSYGADNGDHPFPINWSNEMSQLGQATTGGAIGGTAAHALFSRMLKNHPDVAYQMHEMVLEGKGNVIRDFVANMHAQGRLDHNWITSDGKITSADAGNSRNDETKNILDGLVNYMEELRDASGIKDTVKNNKAAALSLFSDVINSSSVGKDAADLSTKIASISSDLEKAKASLTPNTDLISSLQKELDENQGALQKIIKGEFVHDYVTEGLYNTLALVSKDPSFTPSNLSGKEFNALMNALPETRKKTEEKTQEAITNQATLDAAATASAPEGASEERVASLNTEAKTRYEQEHTDFLSQLQELGSKTDENGEQSLYPENLHPSASPETRQEETNVLKNLIPSLEGLQAEGAVKLVESAENLSKVEKTKGTKVPVLPPPSEELLKMTEGKGSEMTSSPSSIDEKINEELELRDASVASGISMYSNSPQLVKIKDSIGNRIAQVKALIGLKTQLETSREAHKLPALPEFATDELVSSLDALNKMMGLTNLLLAESESNSASADLKVAQATASLLGKTADYMNSLSELSVGTEFEGIKNIVAQKRAEIHKGIEETRISDTLRLFNEVETAIYEEFSQSRDKILSFLEAQEFSDFSRRTYDYVRGILSLSSADFWNAYHSVLVNSNTAIFSPTDEHSILVKQAVQGLMADNYSPPSLGHPNQILHHNSAFVEGRGGTAKTKTMIPLITGTVQTLTGGKAFLTAAKDVNDYKRSTLLTAVENFFRVSDKQLGVQIKSSTLSIQDFMKSPGETEDVNLIVFDEGTLLSTSELSEVQVQLNKLNKQRVELGKPLLKILYTGDTVQNSIGVNKANPDARAIGIDDTHRHVIQRTPALTFSFRSSNQQLSLFSAYLESIQKEVGTSRPFATEYSSREGVQIHQSKDEFVSNAASYISSLSKQSRLHEAVYITDKGKFSIDQRILDSGILIMTSEEAQGREWPIVFFDPVNTTLFTPNFNNLGVKKDYYTAATRASSYLLTHVMPGQGVSSAEGSVNKIRPLTPEQVTRQATIEKVNVILGNLSAPVSTVSFDYSKVTIKNDDNPFEIESKELRDANYDSEPSSFSNTEDLMEGADSMTKLLLNNKTLIAGSSIVDYLTASNRDGLISLHTFFTNELHNFDEQMGLKRKAIFNLSSRKTIPYFLSINRIGSPGYENVLRNNPEFTGSYALFIEAGPQGNNVILGTLSSPGLDVAIKEGNLLQGRESMRIPLSADFLSDMENTGVTVVNKAHKVKSLKTVKDISKGIRFGTPYIVTIPRSETNVKGEARAKAGEIFVPASFYYTSDDIGKVLAANNDSAYITKVPFRTTYVPFSEIVNRLDNFLEDGKFNFNADNGLSGRLYDTFWSHNAESGTKASGEQKESRLSVAFKALRDKTPQTDPFYKFLDTYVEKAPSSAESEIISTINEMNGDAKQSQNNNARYFMKHYLEAKQKGAKNLVNFERAITGLSSHPYFRKGFEFNPRILYGSTQKSVTSHAQARQLPQEYYDTYLEAELDYVSPPILRIPLNHLISAIKESVPQPIQQKVEKEESQQSQPASAPQGQSPVEYVTPTLSESFAGPSEDQDIVSDSTQSQKTYEDDSVDPDPNASGSLEDFQNRWFSKPGYSTMFPQTVREFKRNFMNYLFALNGEDGSQPFLRDISTVVKSLNTRAKEVSKTYTNEFLDGLDPVRDEANRDLYVRAVQAREFGFLLSRYFPTVWQNPVTKEWKYRSNHHKQRSFSEKESFNLLAEGMTDMVKTQLYNTPVIRRLSDGSWSSSGDFVWEGDIESLVNTVTGAATNEEISAKLQSSGNQAAQSVYMRFLSKEPYKLDGKTTWSIGAIQNPEVFQMRDSILQFMLSGQVYDLTKVNLDDNKLKAPWSIWGAPNTIREISHQSIAQVAENQGKFIVLEENGSAIIGPITVSPSNVSPTTDQGVVDAIHAMGLTSFSLKNLKEMQELDFPKFNIAPSNDVAQKVNNAIIDQIILPTMKKMAAERFVSSSFRKLNILYDSVIRSSGVPNILSDIDVNGNKAYRLRWGAPIYRLATQIEEIRDDSASVLANNLLVKGDYQVEKIPIKSGFESWKNSKGVKSLSAKEIGDFDVVWSFAHMLKETHADSGQYNVAMMTPMVWSDSPTDPQMIVRVPKGYFRAPQSILGDLFEARKAFYTRHSGKILTTWNNFLLTHPARPITTISSLQNLKSFLANTAIPLSDVQSFPGMIDNLYYTKAGKTVTIKQSLIDDVNYYSGSNLADFIKKADSNFSELLAFSNDSFSSSGESMTERLGKVIDGKSGQEVLKAFYYNWLAFSSEFSNLTAGPIQQYKDKGKGETDEYIDNVKRNKLLMANRSSMLYRNQSWKHLHNHSKLAGIPLTEEQRYEGRKLPRIGKIAYVKDVKQLLSIPSGLKKDQEVYDGATFVFPTTRLMQKNSNSGNHGIYVGAVMKNVTTILNNSKGVPTYIKNAEYLMTPELMRLGTPRLTNMVKRAYSHPFSSPIQAEGKVLFTPLDYLYSKGMAEDFSNADWARFDDLLNFLVDNAEQDSLILEVAPDSSVKTGRGATNEFDAVSQDGKPLPYVTENFEQVNKGTQLDASHGIDEISNVRGSQIINAMAVNWHDNTLLMRMYNGLAEIAYTKIQEWKSKSPAAKLDALKAIATSAFSKRQDTSYASKVTSPSNSNNFSIDDRQIVTTVIRGLTSELTDDAVLLDFEGGQFIVHPTNGLIQVYDVIRNGIPTAVLKSELTTDEKSLPGRDLKWQREDNFAEILLPASMRKKFGIKPGMKISDVSPEYFASLSPDKPNQARKAARQFKDFQKTLSHLVTRIPATGKHSAVAAKIVGFIEESENSVFVPAELLFVQGADQDADKGTNFTQEVVSGLVPEVDESFELKNKTMFPDKSRKVARIAGIKNAIVKAMQDLMTSPTTEVERNMTVDNAKEELEKVASVVESTYDFKRDSYLSYLRMREINQAGMTLRGIFSFAMKSYQVMTTAYRAKGIDPSTVGLSTDPLIAERLGALVNAAVDNAKDQLLGKLGIGDHNSNMVSYMVMKGLTFEQIHQQLVKYGPQMDQMKDFRRYDSTQPFRASVVWANNPELSSLYYLGNEVSRIAALGINRVLPSSDVDMIAYRKSTEAFINGQYKAFNISPDFKLISFLENDEYAEQQVAKYQGLKGKKAKGGITRSEFNVLQILRDAPHIKAYMQVYLLSHNLASESKLYKVSSRLADEVMAPTAQLDDRSERVLSDMKEFTYGLFIDQYLQNAENPTDYDLSSPVGRRQFVESMNEKFVNTLKMKYPVNSFIDSLTITPDVKRNWKDTSLLRLPDLQQTTEEKRMQIQADFATLDDSDRKTMVMYNIITRHGKFAKDSFGSLLSPEDKADLNRFLDRSMDITNYDYGSLSQMFNDFRSGKMQETGAIHNSIPYQARQDMNSDRPTPVQLAGGETIPADTAERLSDWSGTQVNTRTPLSELSDTISSILSRQILNPMETTYLKALKDDIVNRSAPDGKTVNEQAKGCAPK